MDECFLGFCVVVDAFEEDALVTGHDSCVGEFFETGFDFCGEFFGVIGVYGDE